MHIFRFCILKWHHFGAPDNQLNVNPHLLKCFFFFSMHLQIENAIKAITSKKWCCKIDWGHIHKCVHIYISLSTEGTVSYMYACLHIHALRPQLPTLQAINLVFKELPLLHGFGMRFVKGHIPCTIYFPTLSAQTRSMQWQKQTSPGWL